MTVIRFCITCDDHQLKKLLQLYWEIVPKTSADNKPLPEMILVCNALRNDLMSPNEYIRGSMLRFLCKLKEVELIEPLIPSIKQSLEHRHSYVRRNAALAVYNIHKTFGEQLLPDGPELIEKFIVTETDISARRNAFLMLVNEAEGIAIDFLSEHVDEISKFGDGFALLVLELTRKVCRRDPNQKSRFVKCLFQLLKSESHAVSYEAAWSLVSLSSAPTAIRAAAQTYAQLLNVTNDNNVKLIVLDRLGELKKLHSKVLQEVLMDILRVLSSPNIDISKKTLALAIEVVGPRNIEEVMQVLKREVVRSQETELEHGDEYKSLLISAIHKCAIRYAEVADSVVLVLLDFLSGDTGYDVLTCVKSIVEQYELFRPVILRKVISNFDEITNPDALRVGLWLLGEYCDVIDPSTNESMSKEAYEVIRSLTGDGPFTSIKAESIKSDTNEVKTTLVTKHIVLSDGSYGSVTSTEIVSDKNDDELGLQSLPHLRKVIMSGNLLVGTIVCVTLTKITVKLLSSLPLEVSNSFKLNTLLTITAIGKFTEVLANHRIGVHADTLERLSQCVRILLDPTIGDSLMSLFLSSSKEAFQQLVANQRVNKNKQSQLEKNKIISQPDDLIQFRQLRAQAVQGGIEVDLMDADDISRAIGTDHLGKDASKLKHVYQLTGYSDPVYAEATLVVHDYDIIVEILIINRTPNTLTNLTIELATMGDLKIVERPQSYTIGPMDEKVLRANIKVSSTETGHVFGTIVFDNASTAQKSYVTLNDIQLDIMDYIRPAECKHEDFRHMWEEFEWENKVAINTNIHDLKEFLQHIVANTNTRCLTSMEDSYAVSLYS